MEQAPAALLDPPGRSSFVKSVFSLAELPLEGWPEIAFAGRSNVGKSSLMNCLLNRRKLVKVSGRPGCTRCLNYFNVDDHLYFVDLPGYGFARVPAKMKKQWQELIGGYLESRVELHAVVLIVDIRHEAKASDRQMLDWLKLQAIPFVVAYTKADKLSANKRARNAAILDAGLGIAGRERVVFSAANGLGRDELLYKLRLFL